MLGILLKIRKGFAQLLAQSGFKIWLLVCLLVASGIAAPLKRTVKTDLDLDGQREIIVLNAGLDQTLQIRRGKKLLWQGVPLGWKPWKLEIADVDGDGRREILVGVFKATKFFPKPHNCLFIYGFADESAFPKWLGSSLGRPFTDFTPADLDGENGDELVALETTLEGKRSLSVYRWNSFGFTLERELGEWGSAKILSVEGGTISIEADGKKLFFAKVVKR